MYCGQISSQYGSKVVNYYCKRLLDWQQMLELKVDQFCPKVAQKVSLVDLT